MKKLFACTLPVAALLFVSTLAAHADPFSVAINGSSGYWVPAPTPPPPGAYAYPPPGYYGGPPPYYYGPGPYYGPRYYGPPIFFGFGFGFHGHH